MIDNKVEVAASCDWCRGWRKVKLEVIAAAKGRDYSLVNTRTACRLKPHCPGSSRFHYKHNVMLPLWDDATSLLWIAADNAKRAAREELKLAGLGRLGRFRDGFDDEAIVDPASGLSARDLDAILGRRIKPPPKPPGYVTNACAPKFREGDPLPAEPPLGVDALAWNNAPDDRARKRLIRNARG